MEDTDIPIYEVVEGETVQVTQSSDEDSEDSEETTTDSEESETTTTSTEGSSTESGEEETTTESYQSVITGVITDYGFTKYVDDTYIYTEDDNYLGQAIVNETFVQIYVMTRTTTFDSDIKGILQVILPEGYENVYASFISAESDQTLESDGMTVRIVVAENEDHAQLIIYY